MAERLGLAVIPGAGWNADEIGAIARLTAADRSARGGRALRPVPARRTKATP